MSAATRRPVVALVTDAVAPYHHGGKEQRTAQVARHLTAYADVQVHTMKWWDDPTTVITDEHGVELHAIAPRRDLYAGERRSIAQAVVFALYCLRLLTRRFDRLEVDSIPVFPLFTAKLVCLLRRKELVCTWHEVWGTQYWRDYLGGAQGRLAGWLERTAIRLPDHIVAASPHTAERLRPLMSARQQLSSSRSGVDLALVKASEPDEQASELCVVGRLLEHKRVDLLIDVVAQLRAEGRDCRTLVVGSGPEADRLRSQASSLGVADLISFRDDVADTSELYGLLKASRIFVFPSEREGFGIAPLEAMACGLPVVTTTAPDNAAQSLVASSGAGAVVEPTVASISEAVAALLDDPDTSGPADHWLDQYGWERVAADLAGVLRCA